MAVPPLSSLQTKPTFSCKDRFHVTSRQPYWCTKTMKRRPCLCSKPFLWELNSAYVKTFFCSNKFAWLLATWVKTIYCGEFNSNPTIFTLRNLSCQDFHTLFKVTRDSTAPVTGKCFGEMQTRDLYLFIYLFESQTSAQTFFYMYMNTNYLPRATK